MRYFLVNYYRKPSGKMDEVVSVSRRVRLRDLQSAAVILDFGTRTVIKCSMDGVVVPKDWQRIRDFYHQYYKQIIQDLEGHEPEKNHTD
jgi:hypothetical protein